ncbi:MAG: hypothetical protein AAB897_02470 [Patescibacteria group bacterium]
MDLLKTLQQFKNIEPNKDFTRKSRRELLGGSNIPFGIYQNILRTLEVGASVALAGLLILVILGGASYIKFFEPLQITAIDPASIKAEAEAIDIQIELANLNYNESVARSAGESTVSVVSQEEGVSSDDSEFKVLSIEEALDLLSQ